ncbi:MAG TPA: 7,8-didemethyl-8-hydroxy-5-deazariboflavin synthase CofG, partial [Stellaceae bacterium]
MTIDGILARVLGGERPTAAEALALADGGAADLPRLMQTAATLRDRGHGDLVSYSPKVFIPLTQLCRDVCHYCTFAHPPRPGEPVYLSADEVLAIARAGAAAGCYEALFTLGDKPELRYGAARAALAALGHDTTLSYLAEMAGLVLRETGLLPHLNPGIMTGADLAALRRVSASQGIMLESAAERLGQRGGPHFGSLDKDPAVRLDTISAAGEAAVPFTSGILIGIGETRRERIQSLLALRDLNDRHGHIQEIIIQNFRAKPGTLMATAPEPSLDDHLWTIAVARLIFGPAMSLQAPPNLNPAGLAEMVEAGINDWGGVSPVTRDHVNPEAPWPALDRLQRETKAVGKELVPRLAIYPAYALEPERWLDPALRTPVLRAMDAEGFARPDCWIAGSGSEPPAPLAPHPIRLSAHGARERTAASPSPRFSGERDGPAQREREEQLSDILDRASAGEALTEPDIVQLFQARGDGFAQVCDAADQLRRRVNGDTVSYVVTRNINYTNVCYFRCQFCAFSKGKLSENLRGRPYDLDLGEIRRRVEEAWERGATEVCLQGGIHPEYTGATYLGVCRAIKEAVPGIHVHAFSPLEIWQGAKTLGRSIPDFLRELKEAGLSSLPGTAAEILDDEIRAVICPDKIKTAQWLEVMEAAHGVGLRSTVTIMYGHVEGYRHWARHL